MLGQILYSTVGISETDSEEVLYEIETWNLTCNEDHRIMAMSVCDVCQRKLEVWNVPNLEKIYVCLRHKN